MEMQNKVTTQATGLINFYLKIQTWVYCFASFSPIRFHIIFLTLVLLDQAGTRLHPVTQMTGSLYPMVLLSAIEVLPLRLQRAPLPRVLLGLPGRRLLHHENLLPHQVGKHTILYTKELLKKWISYLKKANDRYSTFRFISFC